jgi:hypothetical protein
MIFWIGCGEPELRLGAANAQSILVINEFQRHENGRPTVSAVLVWNVHQHIAQPATDRLGGSR